MADDDVNVKFSAQVAEMLSGMRDAANGVKQFAATAQNSIKSLATPFAEFQRMLLAIGSIAAGGALFKDIIDSSVQAAGETNKLAKTFGITLEEASALRVELKSLGISVDDYVGYNQKLDRQIRTNESTLRGFGLQTRDVNGQLLSGQALMETAISFLKQYKEGTDRNIAAQTIFGARVGDVNKLLRMTSDAAVRAKKDMADLGLVVTADDKARAIEYKQAIAQLSLTFEGIKKAIGDAVLPYLTQFAQWFRSQGPAIISGMKDTVRAVVEFAFDTADAFVRFGVTVATGIYNMFVVAQYLRAKFGLTTTEDANKSIDGFESVITRLETLRDRAIAGIAKLRETVLSGGGAPNPFLDAPKGGNASATPLLQAGQARQAALEAIETERRVLQIGLQDKKNIYEDDVANHKLTEEQKIAKVIAATEEEYQAELALLNREKAIGGQSVAERQKILDKIKVLEEEHERDIRKLQQDRVAAIRKTYDDVFGELQGAFNSQLRGLLSGTTTFAQAFKNILGDLLVRFIEFCEKMAFQWLAAEAAKTAATETGTAARTAAEQAGAAASLATLFTSVAKAIAAAVQQVFAGVSAFFAPTLGPAAPAAGAAVAAGVAASAALPSLDVGGYVLKDGMAKIHRGETITPAAQVDSPWRAGSGGQMVFSPNISALDGHSVKRMMPMLAAMLKEHLEQTPSARPAY